MASQDDIVIHITSGETEDWRMALRNIQKLAGNDSDLVPRNSPKV